VRCYRDLSGPVSGAAKIFPAVAGFGGQRLGSRPSFSALTGRCGLEQSSSTLAIAVRSAKLVLVGVHWRSSLAALGR
jgi:hypothetical protein